MKPRLRIATRASQLALWQARHVAGLLLAVDPELAVDVVEVSTAGDRDRTEPLSQIGGIGVFTREVQAAVLDGRADVAVHSLKDLPTAVVEGLTLAGVPVRGPRFDALILPVTRQQPAGSLDDLSPGARVGTGSLRRQAQLLHTRPDLVMCEIRGNVETRLRKLDAGEYDAIVLAQAGLERLGLANRISLILDPPLMFPAVGQAALGLECRADDEVTIQLLQRISDRRTLAEVTAERACLHELLAGCHAPVGVLTEDQAGNLLRLHAVVLSSDGRERMEADGSDSPEAAATLGQEVARRLGAQGVQRLLSHDT
ncbi:MAG: hydroxymethylbilane synthase [Planctomycetaceae bacterium]